MVTLASRLRSGQRTGSGSTTAQHGGCGTWRKRTSRGSTLIQLGLTAAVDPQALWRDEHNWVGGEVTPLSVRKGRRGENRYVADPDLVELVRDLAEEFTDDQIARILDRKGIRTPTGRAFTTLRVTSMRGNHDIPGRGRRPLRGDDVYDADQAGEMLGVDRGTVVRWARSARPAHPGASA